jgi:acetyltransferase-like isoleucine patch superfamily enzyme
MNRLPRDALQDMADRRSAPMTHPFAVRFPGYGLRRLGLSAICPRQRRGRFGAGCDVGESFRLTVASRTHVPVEPGSSIDSGLTLGASGIIDVGADTIVGHRCTVADRSNIIVGHERLIGEAVAIRNHDQASACTGVQTRLQGDAAEPVRIGYDVRHDGIQGCEIGDQAIVSMKPVVRSDLPPGAVVGSPARVTETRSDV